MPAVATRQAPPTTHDPAARPHYELRAQSVARRNAAGKGVDWRFNTADARVKLKRLYPLIEVR